MSAINHLPIPELYVSAEAAEKLTQEAQKLPGWFLSASQLNDLKLLLNGGFYPLKGFMTQADCHSVVKDQRLTSGAVWPVIVTLEVSDDFAAKIEPGDDISLIDADGTYLALMSVTDHWRENETVHLGGKIKGLRVPSDAGANLNLLRRQLELNGWNDVLALLASHDIGGEAFVLMPIEPDTADTETIPLSGQTDATNDRAITVMTNLTERPAGMKILSALVARNFGATHVLDSGDPKINQTLEAAGLQILQIPK